MKHTKKRVAALLLALAMVLSLMPMAFAADEFPDMPAEDDASYAAVKSAVDNGIMSGENGKLNLEGSILRSTVAKMVVTAFAAKGEADLSGYPDVDSDAWYAAWMAKANQMGIMTGTSGKMNPSNEVTLAEVAAMLVRALGLPTEAGAKLDGVADWAAPYVKALIDAGYLAAEAAADAGKPMTRAAFADVIYKVSGEGNYAKEENAEITEDVDGNIVITANGVSLKGITVKGDVIIADGVDAGTVTLDGVTVEGRVVVRGAGANLTNGTTASATVVAAPAGETTVKADANSDAGAIAVAGTNGQAAEKVVIDMAEPKVSVNTATEVAVQNATGGEVTLAASGAKVAVESGTLDNVTVADGASNVAVDVAKDAAINKVTTNTDLAITGDGAVNEKEGSGTVTDSTGAEVGGGDEPVVVPPAVDEGSSIPAATPPEQESHVHNYAAAGDGVRPLNATHHLLTCVDKAAVGTEGQEGYKPAIIGCGATILQAHTFVDGTDANAGKKVCSVCGYVKLDTTSSFGDPTDGAHACPEGTAHHWVKATGVDGDKPATCDEAGKQTWKCDNKVTYTEGEGDAAQEKTVTCTATRVETIPATGHNPVLVASRPATCGANGYQDYKCSICNKYLKADGSYVETLEAGQHSVTIDKASVAHTLVRDPANDKASTCKTAGWEAWKCSVCGADYEDGGIFKKALALNPNNHEWGVTNVWTPDKDAEEHFLGTHTRTCTNEAHETPVKETRTCSFSALKTAATAATCAAPGATAVYECPVCKATKGGEAIPQLANHTFAAAWSSDANGHWHKCAVCDTYNAVTSESDAAVKTASSWAAHTWNKVNGEGSPVSGSYCTVCGYRYVAPHAHSADTGTWLKNETAHWHACSADGCTGNTTTGVGMPDYATHQAGTTDGGWTKDGSNAVKKCATCQYEMAKVENVTTSNCPLKDETGHGTTSTPCPLCGAKTE